MKSGCINHEIKRRKSIHGERGMTIVELVVAMSISAILTTMLFKFFADQTSNFAVSKQTSEMQQEVRWALNFLSDHTKLAGNGIPPNSQWAVIEAVNGEDGAPDLLKIMGCFKSVDITIDQIWGNAGAQEKLSDTSEIIIGDLAVISDGTNSEVFIITDKTDSHVWHDEFLPWNDDKKLDHRYAAGSTITIVTYYSFFIDTDEEGRTNLMLKHHYYEPQILAGDVEDFQVRFQMKDGSWIDEPDMYEIYDIRIIELILLARTPEPLKNYIDPVYGDGYKRIETISKVTPKNVAIL